MKHKNTPTSDQSSPQANLSDEVLLQAFKYDLQLRNVTPKTLKCYEERMKYFQRYLQESDLHLSDVTRSIVHGYIMSIRDTVSAETVNGRLRIFKVFWNFLLADGLWEHDCVVSA